MAALKACIVGLGRWGQRLVESVQGKSDRITFVAGVTRTPAKSADFAARHGFPLGTDLDTVLADLNVEAVVLATPHSLHEAGIVAAAAAGKPVFCDKPFTLELAAAERAVAAATEAGIVLAAGFNRRFLPAARELRRRVDEGSLGTLLHVEAQFSTNLAGRYAPGSWRLDRAESPAGGMTGLGVHVLDQIVSLLGPADLVTAHSRDVTGLGIDDTTSVLLRFPSGATATLTTIVATATIFRVHVYGTRGHAELRGQDTLAVTPIEGAPEVLEFPVLDTERLELEAFADAVRGLAPYPVPTRDVLAGVAAFEALVQSAAGNVSVVPGPVA